MLHHLLLKWLLGKVEQKFVFQLKTNILDPLWPKVIALAAAVENLVFFSPLYYLGVKPDEALVAVHLDEYGCTVIIIYLLPPSQHTDTPNLNSYPSTFVLYSLIALAGRTPTSVHALALVG